MKISFRIEVIYLERVFLPIHVIDTIIIVLRITLNIAIKTEIESLDPKMVNLSLM